MSLSQFGTDYSFKLDDNGYLKDNVYFERLLLIDKSIEWSKIAKIKLVLIKLLLKEIFVKTLLILRVYCRSSFLSANEAIKQI